MILSIPIFISFGGGHAMLANGKIRTPSAHEVDPVTSVHTHCSRKTLQRFYSSIYHQFKWWGWAWLSIGILIYITIKLRFNY